MKRGWMALCFALALWAGQVYGTTYTWINANTTGAGREWQTGSNWDLGSAPGATDDAYVGNGGAFMTTDDISVGSLRMGGASTYTMGTYTLTTGAAGGSGDLILRGNQVAGGTNPVNVYGNFYWTEITPGYTSPFQTINMYGTSKWMTNTGNRYGWARINIYGTVFDNGPYDVYDSNNVLSVKAGAKIITRPNNTASKWEMWWLDLADGQSNLPAWGDCVTFQYVGNSADNGIVKNAIRGGLTYGYDLTVQPNYSARKGTDITWRVKGGAFTVGRDFTVSSGSMQTSNAALRGNLVFSSLENGTANSVNFTVCQDLKVGVPSGGGLDCTPLSVLKLNNSTVRVGRDLIFGWRSDSYYVSNGAANFDNATIFLGRDFTVYDPQPAKNPSYRWVIDTWNAGTSTIICDGNGTSATYGRKSQIITTYGYKTTALGNHIALNSLVIRNECGTVSLANSLAGQLVLTGDLRLEKGKFNDNDRSITFNGPGHTLFWDCSTCSVTGNSLDNIILLPNAVLTLNAGTATSITMDNLLMQSGSKLYLNGFTLVANGQTWISGQVSELGVPYTWGSNNGTIFGTMAVPEPATLLLLGSGAMGFVGWMRRRRMR